MIKQYQILYRLLKETGISNRYDEDSITITNINGEKYTINLNCLFIDTILIDDNDNTILFNQLTLDSQTDIINYMKKKMEGN